MTIDNKEWLWKNILRLYLSGLTQEEISRELDVSEGTINAILQELIASDNTLELQHEIAIVCKKTGQSPKQLASNLRFENVILRMGYNKNKLHDLLGAINRAFVEDGSVKENYVAKLILDISDLVLKKGMSLGNLYPQIESKYQELNKLNEETQKKESEIAILQSRKNLALIDYQTTVAQLEKFAKLKEIFDEVGLDIDNMEETRNVLLDFQEHGDAIKIVEELKAIRLLDLKKADLEMECKRIVENLDEMQKRKYELEQKWGYLFPSIQVISNLLQAGVSADDISQIFQIPYIFENPLILPNLCLDLEIYGKLSIAIFTKEREYESLMNGLNTMRR